MTVTRQHMRSLYSELQLSRTHQQCVSKKLHPFCFRNNLVECQPISIIFGTVTPE